MALRGIRGTAISEIDVSVEGLLSWDKMDANASMATWNEAEKNSGFDHIKNNGGQGQKDESVAYLVMMQA